MQIGFGVFLFEAVAVMGYLATSPARGGTPVMWAVSIACVVAGAPTLVFVVPVVARQPWRERFSLGWTLVTIGAVGVVAPLDGGLQSPLLLLLFLPIVYAALALPAWGTVLSGLSTLIVVGAVGAVGRDFALPHGSTLMILAILTGVSFLAVASSANRGRLERLEGELLAQLARQASVDSLTGCLNHAAFNQRLVEEVSRAVRQRYELCLAIIDIDHFKQINDSDGHLAGDRLLAGLGEAIRQHSRVSDVVGRIGGDEFVLLMPHASDEDALGHARRLRDRLAGSGGFTVSIGIAALDRAEPSAEQLLRDADLRLYEVKRTGRDNVAGGGAASRGGAALVRLPTVGTGGIAGR